MSRSSNSSNSSRPNKLAASSNPGNPHNPSVSSTTSTPRKLGRLAMVVATVALAVIMAPSASAANIGDYKVLASSFNAGATHNGTDTGELYWDASVDVGNNDVLVQSVTTYHWNYGAGSSPGTIALYDYDSVTKTLTPLGEWNAVGRSGQGGAPNVYWDIFPNIVLPARHLLRVVDSNNSTWSSNSESDGMGFVEIRGTTDPATIQAAQSGIGVDTSKIWTRLAGPNRYDTMSAIVQTGFNECNIAVVATGSTFPDALAASALAGAYGAPVILTGSARLNDRARYQLQRLGVTRAYIMGGESAVSEATENAILGMGIQTVRLQGKNRYETSMLAYQQILASGAAHDTVIVATGKSAADSLSIGPYAYARTTPIVLASPTSGLSDDIIKLIRQDSSVHNIVIVGGKTVVPEKVKSQLGSGYFFERLAGANRYETSAEIAKWALGKGMSATNPAIASTKGSNAPDALAGAALCGKRNSVLVLVRDHTARGIGVLSASRGALTHGYVLGGTAVIPDSLASYVASRTDAVYLSKSAG